MEELKVKLKSPIEVSVKGDYEKVYELVFVGPSYKEKNAAFDLEQIVARALTDIAKMSQDINREAVQSTGDEKMEPAELGFMLKSSNQRVSDIYDLCAKLFTKVCTVYGEEKGEKIYMSEAHMRQMSVKEFERICLEYLANFTVPSVTSE